MDSVLKSDSPSLLTLSMDQLVREVKAAFNNYDSLPELSRSPLACPNLIAPALVLDAAQPTIDDQGRALRVALRWAVGRLAPAPPPYPLGVQRPFDDPAWQDPLVAL